MTTLKRLACFDLGYQAFPVFLHSTFRRLLPDPNVDGLFSRVNKLMESLRQLAVCLEPGGVVSLVQFEHIVAVEIYSIVKFIVVRL